MYFEYVGSFHLNNIFRILTTKTSILSNLRIGQQNITVSVSQFRLLWARSYNFYDSNWIPFPQNLPVFVVYGKHDAYTETLPKKMQLTSGHRLQLSIIN